MIAPLAFCRSVLRIVALTAVLTLSVSAAPRWVGTWATAPVPEPAEKENLALAGSTLRQVVRVSLGGERLRVRLSNAFGAAPLSLHGASIALAGPAGAIQPASLRALRFSGRAAVTIPAGASYLSDPLEFPVPPQGDVAISLHFNQVPAQLTVHGGARATSFLVSGDALAAPVLAEPTRFTRWYFINGLDVVTDDPSAASIVLLGDSITDGYGVKPETNQRWPDEFVRLLQARTEVVPLGVLNLGIGGNALLRGGLGPNALARFDRDVLGQAGARWLMIFEGINDLGGRIEARKKGAEFSSAAEIIAAYEQLIARARTHGLRVLGATITPYEGADFYFSADGEADRQTINHWIRTCGLFDAVVDFDAALRDPANPSRLAPAYDSGDHLHPSMAGYKHLAESVDLALFKR